MTDEGFSTAGFSTKAIHAGWDPDGRTGAVNVPIYASSTFAQDGVGGMRDGFEYARTGNPTRRVLEANLAAREAGYDSAVETYNAGLVSAVRQTADALARLDEATQRTQSQRQAVAALETNRQLADVLAQQGLQDRTLQLEQRYVRDLQVFRLKTCQGDKYAALIDLIEALGGGLSPAAAKT